MPSAPEWAVREQGAGPLRVGMTLLEAEAAIGADMGPLEIAECEYRKAPGGPDGLLVMFSRGQIARFDVTSPAPVTAAGARIGDSDARIRELYGTEVVASPHKYTDGQYLTVAPDKSHRLVFETDGGKVTRYRAGRLPEVEWIEGCS